MPAASLLQFWIDSGPAVAAAAPDILEALVRYLEGVEALAEVEAIYLERTGPRPAFPFLLVDPLGDFPTYNTSESALWDESFRVTLQSTDDTQASRLGKALFRSLTPKAANARLTFADGKEVTRAPSSYRKPGVLAGAGPGGVRVWEGSCEVRFTVSRDLTPAGWAGPPPAGDATAPDILEALQAHLESAPGLAEVAEVYLETTGPRPEFPFLVVNPLFDSQMLNTSDSYLSEEAFQVTLQALDDRQATRLGKELAAVLSPAAASPRLAFEDGQEVTRSASAFRKPGLMPGAGPGGVPAWMTSIDVRFLVGRDL